MLWILFIFIRISSTKMEVISPAFSTSSIMPTTSFSSSAAPIVVPTPLATEETPTAAPTTINPTTVRNIACDSNPCFNGATCLTVGSNGYSCACVPGWDGAKCDTHTTSYEVSTTFEYIIVVGVRYRSYSPLLEDHTTTLYKEACKGLTAVITESLNTTSKGNDTILNVICLGFSFGSIIGNYIVEVKTKSAHDRATLANDIDLHFVENSFVVNSSRASFAIRVNSTVVKDYDECSKRVAGYCDESSTCSNTESSFVCVCQSGYELSASGVCIAKLVETVDNTTLYIIFAILGSLLLLLIILMAIVLRRRKDRRQSYKPTKPSLYYGDTESRFGRESVTTPHFSEMPQERLRAKIRHTDDMEWDPYYSEQQQ